MQIINVDQELARWRRTFRIVIAASRIDADISQEELARCLHVTRNTIAKTLGHTPEELFRRIMMWPVGT
jgi:transcriptional regulator with XRE-family HTH domain